MLRHAFRKSWSLVMALVVAAAMLVISEGAYHRAENQLDLLVVTAKIRLDLILLINQLYHAESSKRGYLFTEGRREYLDDFNQNVATIETSLVRLHDNIVAIAQTESDADFSRLVGRVHQKINEMRSVLRLFDAGLTTEARELVVEALQRDQLGEIWRVTQSLVDRQNQSIAHGLNQVHDTLLLSRLGVATVTACSLVLLGLFLRQSRRLSAQRRQQAQALQRANEQLEAEVSRRTQELFELAKHLQVAREDERGRLARDLHDELGALLTAAKFDVARLRPILQQSAPDALPRLAHLVESLNAGIALKRRIVEDLRPSTLDNLGLLAALEVYCKEFGERTGIQLVTDLHEVSLSRASELTAFRVVQEALTNAAKYSGAHTVKVGLQEHEDWVELSVEDDGCGMNLATIPVGSHGLRGMRFRVESEGGQLSVRSEPGQGVRLLVRLRGGEPAASC